MRRRFTYHWVVFAAAFVVLLGAAGTRSTPSVLIDPLHDEFGWSHGTIGLAVSINVLLFGFIGPFAAALQFRYGLRRVTATALIVIATGAPSHHALGMRVLGAGKHAFIEKPLAPSRKDAEAARKQQLKIPKDPKAAKAAARERDRDARATARAGMMAGDERYLPARDKGPARAFTRDFVDSRFTVAEFFIFVAVAVLVLLLVLHGRDELARGHHGVEGAAVDGNGSRSGAEANAGDRLLATSSGLRVSSHELQLSLTAANRRGVVGHGLLGRVRVIRSGVDKQLGHLRTTQTSVRHHALHRVKNQLDGVVGEQVAPASGPDTTWVARVAVRELLVRLVRTQHNLVGIHDDDVIPRVNVWGKVWTVLAAEKASNFRRQTSKNESLSINHVPRASNFGWLWGVGTHCKSSGS